MEMNFRIYFVNADKNDGFSTPINISYNDSKIRFYWLIGSLETAVKGIVKFEIQATGTNEKNNNYVWKTRPKTDGINILESLSGNGIIKPSDEWYTQFIRDMDSKVADAREAANEAKESVAQANAAIEEVNEKIINAKDDITAQVLDDISITLLNYYTKEEVNTLLEDIDLSAVYEAINNIDGLAKFNVEYNTDTYTLTFYNGETVIKEITFNFNPTLEWITAYDSKVDDKISEAINPIQTDLDNYKIVTDENLASIHNEIDGLPETLATDYYNIETTNKLLKEKADTSDISSLTTNLTAVESTANVNKSNITTLGAKISDIESSIENIDTSPRLSYEATYDEEQIYTLWEIEGEGDSEVRTPKGQFKIQGGGGGTSTSSVLKIEYVTKTPFVVTTNDSAVIKYNFSGTDSSGDAVLEGNYTWKIGNTIIATGTAVSGENSFDATKFISLGTQKLVLSITDEAGSLVTKTWTVQKVDIRIESSFNDKITYPVGEVSFDYIPYGAISKDIHFKVDGEELYTVNTSSSGIPIAYIIQPKSHGSHLVEVYITANINGNTVESNHIYKDIILIDSTSDVPVIGCTQQNIIAKQYDTTNITYTVFDPRTESPTVILSVDGKVISTQTLNNNTQVWQYKTSDVGEHILTIACRDTVKTINLTVEKLDVNIEPITANLAFDFNYCRK